MRQYRGKTKDGKWVKGWYCFVPEREYTVTHGKETVPARHFIIDADETEQCLDRCEDDYVYDISEAHEVIPETVGQSTGLKDKNGKEIFEGDILSISKVGIVDCADPDPHKRIIKWDDERGGFAQFRINGEEGGSGWSFKQKALSEYYEIIGTIHDNTELLEEK